MYLYGIEQGGTAICKSVKGGGREKVERMGKVSTRQAQKLVPVYEHKKNEPALFKITMDSSHMNATYMSKGFKGLRVRCIR